MNRSICPYIGLKDDPTTSLHFPSQGNFCHHAKPISGIKAAHQENYCLTASHVRCPVYQAAVPIRFPAAIASPGSRDIVSTRRLIILAGIPILLAGAAATSFALNVIASRLSAEPGFIPNTGGESAAAQPWSLFTETRPPFLSVTSTPEEPGVSNCPFPQGWAPYIVSPTDSLYRLSIIYGVSVEQLQQVNCMGESTAILPGQVIYIPLLNTNTPTSIPTNPPAQPVVIFNSSDDKEPKRPERKAAQPTPVPPTRVAPTSEPPKPTAKPKQLPTTKPKVKPTKIFKNKDNDKKDRDDRKDRDNRGDQDDDNRDNRKDRKDRKNRDD